MGGSLNQTTMMHRVGEALADRGCDCFYTPFYADGWVRAAADRGWFDYTILGGQARRRTLAYLAEQRLPTDVGGAARAYDLVVAGTDLYLPRNVRGKRLVLVQEGMLDPETWRYHLARRLGPFRVLANTACTGLSHAYARFCVASEGFRDLVVAKGVDPAKVVVTGIPNFDDCAGFLANDFPRRGYVLAATSCLRETGKREDRAAFVRAAAAVAAERGKPLVFKLHPNERHDRAVREIRALAPHAEVFADGHTDHMVANCDVLVTRYSSVVLVAAALGKEVVCDLDPALLRRLAPVQNGGRSAPHIAEVGLEVMSEGR
jgi:hypothetical protein